MELLRRIPHSMDPERVAAIDALLDEVAARHAVFVPLAVESGSRAWGFPSPDSDYDCRFVFVRPTAQHLTPWPLRDVIEIPPEGNMDTNGWDLAKSLRLLLKGNIVIIEWLRSPVIYRAQGWFRDAFLALARRVATREAAGRHYLHLGERQRQLYFGDGKDVAQKKIFYALRPAAALRWLRMHPVENIAPMHFPTLLTECDPPAQLRQDVDDLMMRKAATRELGKAPLPASIFRFIDEEFAAAQTLFDSVRAGPSEVLVEEVTQFYRSVVERLESTSG